MKNNHTEFALEFDEAYFPTDELIVLAGQPIKYIITSGPKRKWHHLLWQFLNRQLYQAPYMYTVKPIEEYDDSRTITNHI